MTTFKRNVFAAVRLTVILLTSMLISSVSSSGSSWNDETQIGPAPGAWGKSVKAHSSCDKGGGTSFPGAGHVYDVDFGEFIARLNFFTQTQR
jgi:hypothetical protein